ncbi:MAG: hypothetical protein ACYCPT_12710 [Acidimicrobiales bacterium]
MAELNSPGSAYPGQFGPNAILTSAGVPVTNTSVSVYDSDGTTLASLYATPAVNTPPSYANAGANPVSTDGYGNLLFYAAPGQYVLSFVVGGVATTETVTVNPWFSDGVWNGLVRTSAYTASSGDSVLANAASAAFTVTLPSPTLGSRVQIVKTDTSANVVTLTTPTGVIQGFGLTASATQTLSAPGSFFQLFADGTNWNVVAQGGGSSLSVLSAGLGGVSIPGTNVATTVASFTVEVGTYLLNASCGFYSTVATTSLYQIVLQGVVGTATATYAPVTDGQFGQISLPSGAAAEEFVVASGSQVITVTAGGTFLIQALSSGAVSTNTPQSTATMLKIV